MIYVVLVEPKTSGNIGAIARSMANFNLKNLILVNPKCEHLNPEAIRRAKHAKGILENSKIVKYSYLKKFDYIIGTTSKLGKDYNIPRSPLLPDEFARKITLKNKTALLFGREDAGLTNKEILDCDFIVNIPSSEYSALNISHAATIIFYELFKEQGKKELNQKFSHITKTEKEIILKLINLKLKKMSFETPQKRETQKRLWKRIIGKAMLTKREAFALLGFLKKIK